MDQRPYRPIRGAARFLNSPLWSRVLRCTAVPRIAYGGALTAALLLSRYVSLSLGRFHCGTGRLCGGWHTAPRQRDWWLSYGHHGRLLARSGPTLCAGWTPPAWYPSSRRIVAPRCRGFSVRNHSCSARGAGPILLEWPKPSNQSRQVRFGVPPRSSPPTQSCGTA